MRRTKRGPRMSRRDEADLSVEMKLREAALKGLIRLPTRPLRLTPALKLAGKSLSAILQEIRG